MSMPDTNDEIYYVPNNDWTLGYYQAGKMQETYKRLELLQLYSFLGRRERIAL